MYLGEGVVFCFRDQPCHFLALTVASVQTPKLQEGVCTEACHNNLFGIIVISFSVCVKYKGPIVIYRLGF